MNTKYDVFLSHNSDDKDAVTLLADRLQSEGGLNPFLDKWHLIPGKPWMEALELALEESETTAVFVGPSGISPWHNEEMRSVLDEAVRSRDEYRVIPVLLPGAPDPSEKPLPRFLSRRTWVDFRLGLDDDEAFKRLAGGIKGEAIPNGVYKLPDEPAPYRGLLPFEEEHERFYFGRTADRDDLITKLDQHNFVAVVGASGCGKSSLVRAGLLPSLKKNKLLDSNAWQVKVLKPGSDPIRSLANHLAVFDVHNGRVEASDKLTERMTAQGDGLRVGVTANWGDKPQTLLLVIDQFEELFTHCQDEPENCRARAAQFIANLTDAVHRGDGLFKVVITLRADFIDRCLAFPELTELLQDRQVLLGALDERNLREIIMRPAQEVGAFIEKGLVETILRDVDADVNPEELAGILPLVQHALHELWLDRSGPWLTMEAYLDNGGVQGALQRRAQATFDSFTPDSRKDVARRVFVRLTSLGEGVSDTRRRVNREELYPSDAARSEVDAVVQALSDKKARLIVADQYTVEVAHEALIQRWDTLRKWLENDRDALRTHRKLTQSAEEWQTSDREASLLYRGAQLAQAFEWRETNPDEPNVLEREFLDTSTAKEEEEEQQRFRSLMRWTVALAAVAIVAVAAAGIAFWLQSVAAERLIESQVNESLFFAQNSAEQITKEPVASVDWALAAISNQDNPRPYVPQAEFALRQALSMSLERNRIQMSGSLYQSNQVALDGLMFAVGGDQLQLIAPDLTEIKSLSGHEQKVDGVAWNKEGILLSYDAKSVRVWQDSVLLESYDSFPNETTVTCALWRPDHNEITVCDANSIWTWSYASNEPVKIREFPKELRDIRWSADGRWLAAWDKANSLLIWDGDLGGVHHWAENAHKDWIWEAAWSQDNRYLVTISGDATALILDIESIPLTPITLTALKNGSEEGTGFQVAGAKFLDDERFITWGVDSETLESQIYLWTVDGTQIRAIGDEVSLIRDIDLTPDGDLLTFMDDGALMVWDIESGEMLREYDGHGKSILDVAWHGNYLATSAADGTARVWEAGSGRELMTLRGHKGGGIEGRAEIFGLHWLDDERLLTYGEDGTLRIWEIFDADGVPLCSGSTGGGLPICFQMSRNYPGHDAKIESARWIDNTTFVTADRDSIARHWSTETDDVRVIPNMTGEVRSAVWSPDGRQLFTYVNERFYPEQNFDAEIWDAEKQAVVKTITTRIGSAFWLDAGLLLSREQGQAKLVDPATGEIVQEFGKLTIRIEDAQVFENQLATGDAEHAIRIFDLETGEQLSRFQPDDDGIFIRSIQWSGDGASLLSGGFTVTLWDVESGKPRWTSTESGLSVSRPVFSPDDQYIAAGIDSEFYIWRAEDGLLLWSSHGQGHSEPVRGVQWFTGKQWDGSDTRLLLLTWGGDATTRLWHVDFEAAEAGHRATEIMRLRSPSSINVAAINEDGSQILTANDSGVLRIWDIYLNQPETLVEIAKARSTSNIISNSLASQEQGSGRKAR